jgi:nucleoside-diphosphate-sugar epimerase
MSAQVVVVLGASGFIGRRVVAALAATRWARPVAVSRTISRARLGPGIQTAVLDATQPQQLVRVMSGAWGVVSCIAGTAEAIVKSGTALIHTASRMPGPPRIVYLSSMAAYGSARSAVDEATPLRGDLGDYAAAKAAVDELAAGSPFVVRLRPGIVYGSGSPWWSDRIARLLVSRRLGDLGANGRGVCNLVHVDDVADAALRALHTPAAGGEAFNLGTPSPPTWNGYFCLYAEALGVARVPRISAARLALELNAVGPALKVLERVAGDSGLAQRLPAIRPWLINLCRHDLRLRVEKAERLLGMAWRPLDSGLEQTARWFLAGGRT